MLPPSKNRACDFHRTRLKPTIIRRYRATYMTIDFTFAVSLRDSALHILTSLSASFQSMESHCLDRERASADLSSLDAVEVSAGDIIHDSPSIVDQWHVSVLLNRSQELSVTLHDGIHFLPPPTPTVPSLLLTGSVPLSGRTLGHPCSIKRTLRSV